MYILITYDVSTLTKAGRSRLRKVAKVCKNYGQRVQNSVFECKMDHAKWILMKDELLTIIEPLEDSLRFYYLGNNWEKRIEHHGTKSSYNVDGPLII